MCIAFLNNPKETYNLFFESPKETTWFFYVDGIMDMFPYKRVLDYIHFMSIRSDDTELHYETTSGLIEFSSFNEKEEFIKWVQTELEISIDNFGIAVAPYFAMLAYYYHRSEYAEEVTQVLDTIEFIENFIDAHSFSTVKPSDLTSKDMLVNRLKYYLLICQSPQYDAFMMSSSTDGISFDSNYKFYITVFDLLKRALRFDLDAEDEEEIVRGSEKLIIMFEQHNERFALYGMSKEDIINYTPPSVIEYTSTRALHWSKKAQSWYQSVTASLQNVSNPYEIYKLLLTWDYYQDISSSKILQLSKRGLSHEIYSDSRLNDMQKRELLYDHIISQLACLLNK